MPDAEPTTADEGATSESTENTPEEAAPAELGDAGKQALDRMKAERKAAQDEAKALRAELDEFKRSQMSEQEKAIDEAKEAGRTEAIAELAPKFVTAEFKAAAAGRIEEDALATLLDNLNLTSFLNESGVVATDRVKALLDGLVPAAGATDFGQGARSTPALGSDPLLQALKNTVGAR